MKRLSVRLSIVGVLLAIGILAIAQAQRSSDGGGQAPPPEQPSEKLAGGQGATAPHQPAQPQPIIETEGSQLAPMVGGVAPVQGYVPADETIIQQGPPAAYPATSAPGGAGPYTIQVDDLPDGPAVPNGVPVVDGPMPPDGAVPGSISDEGDGTLPPVVPASASPPNQLRDNGASAPLIPVGAPGPVAASVVATPEAGGPADEPGLPPTGPPPAYDPTAPADPAASPYDPTAPAYDPTAPTVDPTAPAYDPAAPTVDPTGPAHDPTGPGYDPTAPVDPAAPAYDPTAPAADSAPPATYAPLPPTGGAAPPETPPAASPYGPTASGAASGLDPQGAAGAPIVDGPAGLGADSLPAAVPGAPHLEGRQAPAVTIEKRTSPEIRVGQAAVFELLLRNVGQATAAQVTVLDRVPEGTEFVDSTPPAQPLGNGAYVWQLGALQPGQEKVLSMRVIPRVEGEIGSVAQVLFQSQASVRTKCTKPQLVVKQSAPEQVLIGDELQLTITISNPGSGSAENVILEEDVPAGLAHRKGTEIDCRIGTLQPGESRSVTLRLTAEQAGVVHNQLRARADGNLEVEDSLPIQIVAPQLKVQLAGPAIRYLRREAVFDLSVANPGTAPATNVEAVVYLPQGMEFVSANNQGRYQSQNHAVYWRLEELPTGAAGRVQLAVMPVETGEQKLRVEGRGGLNLSHSTEHLLTVRSLNELVFTVADVADPIEVGSDTTYEIRVTNKGSRTDSDIRVAVQLPPGMQPLDGDGPTRHELQQQTVVFEPLPRLAPNAEAVYRVLARGAQQGDQRVQVQILSNESPTPVTKEEVTRVYVDN